MMELISVNKTLSEAAAEARQLSRELPDMAKQVALTEKNYRIALMREIMSLRDEKYPATLISDIARGKTADLRYERDLARETYKASMKVLTTLGDSMSVHQSILKYQSEL